MFLLPSGSGTRGSWRSSGVAALARCSGDACKLTAFRSCGRGRIPLPLLTIFRLPLQAFATGFHILAETFDGVTGGNC